MIVDFNAIGSTLLEMGFPGLVILCLGWVILELRKESKALLVKIEELQEKRIAEGRESINALNNTANVLDDVLKAMQAQGAKQ